VAWGNSSLWPKSAHATRLNEPSTFIAQMFCHNILSNLQMCHLFYHFLAIATKPFDVGVKRYRLDLRFAFIVTNDDE